MSPSAPIATELSLPAPVLIVEDDNLVQHRLDLILQQLGYTPDALIFAANLADARARLAEHPVALALVDLGLPDGNGLDLIAELSAADPSLGILVISAWSTEDAILAALRAGATGYVLKEREDVEVALSIRSVLRGGAPIDPFMARRIIAELQPAPPQAVVTPPEPSQTANSTLTTREQEILQLVADGLTNREIAEKLELSRFTVECHVKHIYRKLAVSSRTRAVVKARSQGLLS
ncbi:response regulator transcription factor [Alcaligenaceae bacterium 429]|uniref:LuxR C-terminal-related transcriptional regulator n=1 Tax=Paenalcaligenes sp. Me52 TaxID=3392038 RepID=UPI001091C429|nr:response regulator transcription factor [Alcaligenaceae bacterium 429]